ncbi:polysaccharide pyruvyl transferase family protein [Halarcobacter sp.]|uniref:polysaccharide pyruvyl transferase family protein n=1 Tax=Halarcobacter sp. TaxID=2321133 RepID=UPI003A8CCAC8
MKILVTGLCLSRNLGGPAMALTLIDELDKRLNCQNEYTFCVSSIDFESEKKMAKVYNLNIVRRAELEAYITHFSLLRYIKRFFQGKKLTYIKKAFAFWNNTYNEQNSAYSYADIIINMEGISYIGDGTRGYWEGINSYTGYYFAKKNKKPYCRFIQSFGPLSRFDVNYFAKKEFSILPFIPARGEKSAEECIRLLNSNQNVYSFPDSAVLLEPSSDKWLDKYLQNNGLVKNKYIVLSPSSVVKNIPKNKSLTSGEKYIDFFVKIVQYFTLQNHKIVFLPHMYSDNKKECDREVCKEIIKKVEGYNCFLVEDNLNCKEAKAVISASSLSIVSRYHALVAALSTEVNVVAIGWNIKYYDLMKYYNLENFALDSRTVDENELYRLTIEKIKEYDNVKKRDVLHKEVSLKVSKAFDLLANWIVHDK